MDRYPAPKPTLRGRRVQSTSQDPVVSDDMIEIPTLPETPAASPPPAYRVGVKEMAPDERPRERMLLRGSASLSNGDLLAVLLNTGVS